LSSFLDNLRYPIISTLRKGTVDDPFIFKQDRHIVQNNNIYLQEIPDSFNLFTISNPDIPTEVYTRITIGYPQNTFEYIVDYIFGIVQLHPDANGKNLLVEYWGKGGYFWPMARIWSLSSPDGSQVTQTLSQILETQARSIIFSTEDPVNGDVNPNGSLWFKYIP